MATENILEIKNLSKSYNDSQGTNNVISDMNLTLKEGDFLSILGPSGCGKTTLIRCICGFEKYQGEIFVEGEKVTKPGTDRIMVFQSFDQLYPWKTVRGNIEFPLKRQGIKDKAELDRIVKKQLELIGLSGYEDYYPHQLSGGMKQRVAIARGLALRPKIILMDEPFAALDAMTRNKLQRELHKIAENEHLTVIFITHNIQEALVLGTRVMLMSSHGEVKIDMENPIPKPVTPDSPGYGELWRKFEDAL